MAAISGAMCTGSEVAAKAGSFYPTTFDGLMGSALVQAEGVINSVCRFDYTTPSNADTIGSSVKGILNDTCSSLVAIQVITNCISSYPSRIIAEDMINVNRDLVLRNLSILRDKNTQTFINSA